MSDPGANTQDRSAGVIRVLLIEDDKDDYVLTRDFLAESEGARFHLDWVRTFGEGLAALRERRHDVYLIDYRMGEHSGLELLHEARRMDFYAPVIMLSGQGTREIDMEAMRAGAAYYLPKSYLDAPILERTIRYALELKQTLRALHESEAGMRAVLESTIDGIITIDQQGVIEGFNRAASIIFGYAPEEAIGRNVSMLMPEPYAGEHDSYLARFLDTGEARIIGIGREVSGRRKDGTTFPCDLAVSDLRMHGTRRFLGVLRDISERKRAEEALREAQELAERRARLADIGAITAQIVHDIGNPVAGIVMQANSILRGLDREPPPALDAVRRQVERVLNTSRTLDGLVKGFLDFSREQRLNMRAVHLPDFLLDVSAAWQPMAAQRGLALSVVLENKLPSLRCDEEKMRRVVDNLVKNALEAIIEGPGQVIIRASLPEPDRVRISVEDTGPGVPPGIDPFRLFETTKPEGTGLGLAIVNQIVQAHEGTITFAPRKPRGAVFHVDLPCRTSGGKATPG